MNSAQIKAKVKECFVHRRMFFWFFVRGVSAIGPLLITYLFSRAVNDLEVGVEFKAVLRVFILILVVEAVETIIRVGSKTRIAFLTERAIVTFQESADYEIVPDEAHRKQTVQTLRNLTQAIRKFVTFLYNEGIQGVVSFVAIPLILFVIDKRIFFIELVLIIVYVLLTYWFSKKYEQRFEKFDAAREEYFTRLLVGDRVHNYVAGVVNRYEKVQNLTFFNWVSLQDIISVANFIIAILVVKDIFAGKSMISDLVLIVGYIKESKIFLNNTTSLLTRYMEVKAGVERVVAVSHKGLDITSD